MYGRNVSESMMCAKISMKSCLPLRRWWILCIPATNYLKLLDLIRQKFIVKTICFQKLKDSVSLRFNDRVDFSRYEDGIRQLLNTYVNAKTQNPD